MKHLERAPDDWPLGNILWFAVLIWFSSSLLSQSAYMAIHGLPSRRRLDVEIARTGVLPGGGAGDHPLAWLAFHGLDQAGARRRAADSNTSAVASA